MRTSVLYIRPQTRDRCKNPPSYQCASCHSSRQKPSTGARVAVLASLPENMSDHFTRSFMQGGVAVLHGMSEGIAAISAAIAAGRLGREAPQPIVLATDAAGPSSILNEAASKQALSAFGLGVPRSVAAHAVEDLIGRVSASMYPVALKGTGVAHKSEAGLVALNIADAAHLEAAARKMQGVATGFLAEEMIVGALAEILVGVTRDPTGAFMLTLGAGGVLTEILGDTAHLLLPVSRSDIRQALESLRIAPLFAGYRGKPAVDYGGGCDAGCCHTPYCCRPCGSHCRA